MSVHSAVVTLIETVLVNSPLATNLGLKLGALEADRVTLHLPFRAENVTVAKIVHGGAIASLIDTAGAIASASGLTPEDGKTGGATSAMSINYLSPADGVDLVAEAVVIKRGRNETVSDVAVSGPDGRLIAKGVVTSKLF